MNRAYLFAALFVILGTAPCQAQFRGSSGKGQPDMRWKVEARLADDQVIEGVFRLNGLEVDCEYGTYVLKPEKIKEIEFDQAKDQQLVVDPVGAHLRGTVYTIGGKEFKGTIKFPGNSIDTDLGPFTPNPLKLRKFTLKGKASD